MKLSRGLVQVYTGNGKGKTTAAFGQALRAAGSGLKTCVIQFMKGSPRGESEAAGKLKSYISVEQFGRDTMLTSDKISPEDKDLAKAGLDRALELLKSKQYDLVVLDEINNALFYNLISLEDVLAVIKEKPDQVELILTGREAPRSIIEVADLVTEMVEIKHPYSGGIKARKGIEY